MLQCSSLLQIKPFYAKNYMRLCWPSDLKDKLSCLFVRRPWVLWYFHMWRMIFSTNNELEGNLKYWKSAFTNHKITSQAMIGISVSGLNFAVPCHWRAFCICEQVYVRHHFMNLRKHTCSLSCFWLAMNPPGLGSIPSGYYGVMLKQFLWWLVTPQ